jgi:hypothetical protein
MNTMRLIICALSASFYCLAATAWAEAPGRAVQRATLEQNLEQRLHAALSPLLGPGPVTAVVKIRFQAGKPQSRKVQAKGVEATPDDDFYLPGVPISQGIVGKNGKKVQIIESKYVRKLSAVIYHPNGATAPSLEGARRVAARIVDFSSARGDAIEFEALPPEAKDPETIQRRVDIATAAVLGVLTLGLLAFLFGPFKGFFPQILAAMSKKPKGGGGGPDPMAMAAAAAAGGGGGGDREERDDRPILAGGDDAALFSFIQDDNVEALVKVLRNEKAALVISVLECLPRKVASRAFAAFDVDKRVALITEARNVRYGNPESIRRVEAKIRSVLGFRYGGIDRIARIVQAGGRQVRQETLSALVESDPGLEEEFRGHLLEFEDLLNLPNAEFAAIFRGTSLLTFARVLRKSEDSIVKAACEKLSPEVAELLKQQVRMMPDVSTEIVEDDLLEIVDTVERLRASGVVSAPAGAKTE